jgi:UDP-GlcNAc:undecaprenyl-phosphate/decaprenyl-phosphate GlcNAc-1-phosphate transferase
MTMLAVAFAVALIAAVALTPLVRAAALRRSVVDEPGGRKIHDGAVPLLGGLAIASAVYLALAVTVVVAWMGPVLPEALDPLLAILVGGAIVIVAGTLDDLRGMSPAVKLIAQAAAATGAVLFGLSLETLNTPWGSVELGILGVPLTLVWILAVVNAINLIDGLDGLAAGVVAIALGALFIVAQPASEPGPLLVMVAGTGAALGFLVHNFHPAKIIMGDAGSMFLGFLVATASIAAVSPVGGSVPAYVPLLIVALPVLDMAWAMVRRTLQRRSIFAADAGHVHHRLLSVGLGQRAAVLVLYLVSALLGLAAVALATLG